MTVGSTGMNKREKLGTALDMSRCSLRLPSEWQELCRKGWQRVCQRADLAPPNHLCLLQLLHGKDLACGTLLAYSHLEQGAAQCWPAYWSMLASCKRQHPGPFSYWAVQGFSQAVLGPGERSGVKPPRGCRAVSGSGTHTATTDVFTSPKAPLPMMVRGSKSAALRRWRCRRVKSLSRCSSAARLCCLSSSESSSRCSSRSRR